jgi:hypothetical protein
LHAYEGLLYRKFKLSGVLHWILALKMYHRKPEGYGLQFCPACLAEDEIPYFRKRWRVAFNTVCTKHGTMLCDRCPECGTAIAFHRLDMAGPQSLEIGTVSYCHSCGFDLRAASTEEPISYDRQASALLMKINRDLDTENAWNNDEWNLERYAVMHQLCRIMVTRYKHVHLREFVLDRIGLHDFPLSEGYMSFEMRPILERHHLIQLTMWLLVDVSARLTAAWGEKAVRYNVLLKDFAEPPDWYIKIVGSMKNWRNRLGS